MREEHGSDIFFNGCPVCKDRCCCSNKTLHCDRKNHCYRKCPATKARHTSDNGGSDIKSSADSTELTKPDVLLSSQQCLKKARIHKGENAVVGAPTAYATENGPAPSMGMGYLPQYVMQFPFGTPSTDHGRKVYASLHSFSDGNGTSTHQDCPQMESGDSASCKDGYRLLYDPSVGFYSVPIVIPQHGSPSTYSHVAYTSRPCHPAYSSHPSYGFPGRYYSQESSRMQTQLSASSQEGSSSCLSALSMKCVEAAPCFATSQKNTAAADSNAVDDDLSTDSKQKSVENPPSLSHNKMGRAETRNHLEYISRFDVGDSSRQREISQLAIQCEFFLNEQQNKSSSKQLFQTSVPSKLKTPLEIETEISQKDFRALMALTDNRSNRFSALSTKLDSSMGCASSTEKSDSRSDCTSTSAKSSNRSSDCPSPSATSDSRSSRSDSPGGEGDSDFRSNRSSSSNLSSDWFLFFFTMTDHFFLLLRAFWLLTSFRLSSCVFVAFLDVPQVRVLATATIDAQWRGVVVRFRIEIITTVSVVWFAGLKDDGVVLFCT